MADCRDGEQPGFGASCATSEARLDLRRPAKGSSMCGRFTLRSPGRIKFDGKREAPPPLWVPRFNIAPSQDVLTVMGDDGARIMVPA